MDALQDQVWPDGICYGCGAANAHGLQIKSRFSEDGRFLVATFEPKPYHTAFPGVLYGGLIASLIDCHSNWTAMMFNYRAEGREPDTEPRIISVTAQLGVKYLKPTPINALIHLKSWVEGEVGKRTRVICELGPEGDVTAVGDSVFVRVDPSRLVMG